MAPEVQVRDPIVEKEEPEINVVEKAFSRLYWLIGAVTRPSPKRSLSERRLRAQLYHELRAGKGREEIVRRARALDAIETDYLTQSEIFVSMGDLGEQQARIVIINPPKEFAKDEAKTVVLIPGISNDIGPVGALAKSFAQEGARVIIISYPESPLGKVTPQFAQAVKETPGYKTHADFFMQALTAVEGPIDLLVGHSTGGPIVATMLNDEKFQKRVGNAAMICPVSTKDQSLPSLVRGIGRELKFFAKHFADASRYMLDLGAKIPRRSKDEDTIAKKVMSSLIGKVIRKDNSWQTARVNQGGHFFVISAASDHISNPGSVFGRAHREEIRRQNEQIELVNLPNDSHLTTLIRPEPIVQRLLSAMG